MFVLNQENPFKKIMWLRWYVCYGMRHPDLDARKDNPKSPGSLEFDDSRALL